jgi:hypothetical protein
MSGWWRNANDDVYAVGGGTYYKNVKERSHTRNRKTMGKESLRKNSLPNLH